MGIIKINEQVLKKEKKKYDNEEGENMKRPRAVANSETAGIIILKWWE